LALHLHASVSRRFGDSGHEDYNLALLTKLGWTFLNETTKVWVQQLHQKYIPYGNLFSAPNVPQHLGFGKEFKSVNPCLPLVLVFRYLLVLTSLFGQQLGFLLCLHFFLGQNSQIIENYQLDLSRILFELVQLNGIWKPTNPCLMLLWYLRFQKSAFPRLHSLGFFGPSLSRESFPPNQPISK
jgi:hypothetical protein